jgi:phage tail-like protein
MVPAARRTPSEDLFTPHAIATFLPGLFYDSDFILRFTAGLDQVLVPIFLVLDSLVAYCDPELAPEDFLSWLGQWVGAELDPTWSEDKKRTLVAELVTLYHRRGTVEGLKGHVRLVFGVDPEVEESGGVVVSQTPVTVVPSTGYPRLMVRLRVPDPATVDLRRLEELVDSAKPAGVHHEVEVVHA